MAPPRRVNTPAQDHAGWSYSSSERRRSSLPTDSGDIRARFRPDDLTQLFPLFECRTVFCLLTPTPAGAALFLLWHVKIRNGSLERFRCHPDCFGQRRMGVDRETDVRCIGAHFDCECGLGNQIPRRRSNDAAADNPLVFLVEQHLFYAFVPAKG